MRRLGRSDIAAGLVWGVVILGGAATSPVRADDATGSADIVQTGPAGAVTFEHVDADPFKGSATLTLTNFTDDAWGSLHVEVVPRPGYTLQYIQNIDFVATASPDTLPKYLLDTVPTSLDGYLIDNVVVGATIDLDFTSNPVQPDSVATFTVWTDNTTDSAERFGLMVYVSEVPEPTALTPLAIGLLALTRRRQR